MKRPSASAWKLSAAQLREWLSELVEVSTVVAPVEEDGILSFRRIAAAEQAVVDGSGKSRWSPKEFLFPRSEALYSYRFAGPGVELEAAPLCERRQVLFGVRSCDAAGLVRLDEIFLGGTVDRLYAARRANTTVVSVVCAAPEPACFCTAVGYSPGGEEGCDVQLVPAGEAWLLRSLTDRGRELAGVGAEGWSAATAEDERWRVELEQRAAAQIERSPVSWSWSKVLEEGFEHRVWDGLTRHCLGCGLCAYVCPSCSCFDMNHQANAWCGEQCRSWDACTFACFTRHASGHNPRATQPQRYRQRLLHKFAFKGEDDPFRCVGCGRCLQLCPAGVDILDTVTAAVEAIREGGANVDR